MSDQGPPPEVRLQSDPVVSGFSIASLVCGILGFFTIGFTGLIAVILGHVALSQIKRSDGAQKGRGLAIGGLVTGYLSLLLLVGFGFAIHTLNDVAAKAKVQQVKADFRSLESALEMYRLNAGAYPTTAQGLAALIVKPTLDPEPKRWAQIMKKIPTDSWNGRYVYQFPGGGNPEKPEIISKGPDGIIGTDDDLNSQNP